MSMPGFTAEMIFRDKSTQGGYVAQAGLSADNRGVVPQQVCWVEGNLFCCWAFGRFWCRPPGIIEF